MIPSPGRIVHYRLSDGDAAAAARRTAGQQANPHRGGDTVPMLIVRVWSDSPTEGTPVNGQAFLDGNFTLWVTSRHQGVGPGEWSDPRAGAGAVPEG